MTTEPAAAPRRRLTADARRAEIIEAAVTAFARGGLAGTSTEEVARLAGVSQPYLFRLFGTKRDLFLAAVDRAFDRVEGAFTDAALHPAPGADPGHNAVLLSMARAYGDLLGDASLLRLQLHAFAACDDPDVRAVVRDRYAGLVRTVGRLSDTPAVDLRAFFAEGLLMSVAAAMALTDAHVAWDRICESEPPAG